MASKIIESTGRCPVCGEGNSVPQKGYQFLGPHGWSLSQCPGCGSSFIEPMPCEAALAGFYDESYYGNGDGKFIGPAETLSRMFRCLRARKVNRLVPKGRILDVGCGRGIMLRALKQLGHLVDGIELENAAMVRASRNTAQEIFRSFEHLESSRCRRYEAVCFWHSLEHLPEPGKALEAADRLLAPGGFLIIAAPNMASIQARLSRENWLHLDLPRHLVHFDMNRLAQFLSGSGYRFVGHSHFSQEYNPIDTLCYIYEAVGFGPLYPYRLMGNTYRHKNGTWKDVFKLISALVLLPAAGMIAMLVSNLFSLLGCGSTTTLILRKADSGFQQGVRSAASFFGKGA